MNDNYIKVENKSLMLKKEDSVTVKVPISTKMNQDYPFNYINCKSDNYKSEKFDNNISKHKVLEVVMFWGDTVMDVKHFKPGKSVTLGSCKKNDFL